MVMSFLVLSSTCLGSSLIHFKNGPEYFTRRKAKVLIPLIRFLLYSFVSSFLVLQSLFFFLLSTGHVWWFPLPIFPNIYRFPFLREFWFFLFGSSVPSIIYLLLLFIISMAHSSLLNFIPMSWLYILIIFVRVWFSPAIYKVCICLYLCGNCCNYHLLLESFSHQFYLMIFHRRLSDSNSPQVSRTLFSILAVLHNVVVWMIPTRSLISYSFISFTNLSVTVPKAPITNGIILTFIFHSLIQLPSKFEVLILLFTFFQFYSGFSQGSKMHNYASSFLLIIIRSGRLAEIRWSVGMLIVVYVFSRTDVRLCIYYLFVWSNLNYLHNFMGITLSLQSCLVLHSFCANFLHSLIMWLMVSSLSPHDLHSRFDMIGSYGVVLGCF